MLLLSPDPFDTKVSLLTECKKKKIQGRPLLRIPSFMLIHKALKKGIVTKGIEKIMNPESNKYDY